MLHRWEMEVGGVSSHDVGQRQSRQILGTADRQTAYGAPARQKPKRDDQPLGIMEYTYYFIV